MAQKKSIPVETKVFEIKGKDETFVHISKNEAWLLKAVGGQGTPRGALSRSRAIEAIKQKVEQFMGGEAAVAADPDPSPSPSPADEYDPMAQLDTVDCDDESKAKKPRKGPYSKER